jgi:hypothetical protein
MKLVWTAIILLSLASIFDHRDMWRNDNVHVSTLLEHARSIGRLLEHDAEELRREASCLEAQLENDR